MTKTKGDVDIIARLDVNTRLLERIAYAAENIETHLAELANRANLKEAKEDERADGLVQDDLEKESNA